MFNSASAIATARSVALEAAIEERSWYVTWLDVDPMLDELREDPRWVELRSRCR